VSAREIKNARIRSTRLGVEDHGIFSAYLDLDYGGGGQSFGGYALDGCPVERRAGSKRVPTRFAGLFIARVLEVLEVGTWEKLPGTFCRVDSDWGNVYRIGHPLKDLWFDPRAEFAGAKECA